MDKIKQYSPKPWGTTFLLALFLGNLGVHRFYVRKTASGVLYLLTYGCFGIGWLVDIIRLLTGTFTDKSGAIISYKAPAEIAEAAKRKEAKQRKKDARREQAEYERRMQTYAGVYLSEQQIQQLENEEALPVVDTPVLLGPGEVAVYYSDATRQETKNRVIGRTGNYSGSTVRITKGLSIRTGGGSSRPVYGDVSMQYPGSLVITNKRVVFLGEQKGFEVLHHNITATTAYIDGFVLQSKSKTYELLVPCVDLAMIAFDGARTGTMPLVKSNTDEPFRDGANKWHGDEKVIYYLKEGQKIKAIAELRALYGYGLAEAKEVAERLEANLNRHKSAATVTEPFAVAGATESVPQIDGIDGHAFEYFCADVLRKNGFVKVSVTKGSGDQGVDILAEKGGVKYAIQCKNYASPLGNTPVQEVNAGKTFYNCHVGVVMTNSTFTPGAEVLAQATGVLLWDRTVLQAMIGAED